MTESEPFDLRTMKGDRRFYVYMHVSELTGDIFYIGKGCGKRAWSRSGRNRFWCSKVEKHGRAVKIVASGLSEKLAFELELHLIGIFPNGLLTTHTLGGGGATGHRHSPETREKMRLSHTGVKRSDAERASISKGIKASPSSMQRRKDGFTGSNNPAKKVSNRKRSSIRMTLDNPSFDPAVRAKISASRRGN